mmetsp:Transcript_21250/g.51908  ORF Transcript_21250/g.51908 Transcript_21250/m.51908 type:complete len:227 (+) Transcript_21250:1124-1804(+)
MDSWSRASDARHHENHWLQSGGGRALAQSPAHHPETQLAPTAVAAAAHHDAASCSPPPTDKRQGLLPLITRSLHRSRPHSLTHCLPACLPDSLCGQHLPAVSRCLSVCRSLPPCDACAGDAWWVMDGVVGEIGSRPWRGRTHTHTKTLTRIGLVEWMGKWVDPDLAREMRALGVCGAIGRRLAASIDSFLPLDCLPACLGGWPIGSSFLPPFICSFFGLLRDRLTD